MSEHQREFADRARPGAELAAILLLRELVAEVDERIAEQCGCGECHAFWEPSPECNCCSSNNTQGPVRTCVYHRSKELLRRIDGESH